jgi:hypothetical protein
LYDKFINNYLINMGDKTNAEASNYG